MIVYPYEWSARKEAVFSALAQVAGGGRILPVLGWSGEDFPDTCARVDIALARAKRQPASKLGRRFKRWLIRGQYNWARRYFSSHPDRVAVAWNGLTGSRMAFLAAARETLGAGSHFVVGVDLKKPVAVLESAYDDSQGVTAAFNLNVLRHLGELLDADLDTDRFRHCSSYNPQLGCVQMFLEVIDDHAVNVAGQEIRFVGGERIHTENSFKYDPQEFLALAAAGGYQLVEGWTDSADWFAVYLLEAA